jgi:hypothetical protein
VKLERTRAKICRADLAGEPVNDHRHRVAGVIDKQLVTAEMGLPHRDRRSRRPTAVQLAKPHPSGWRSMYSSHSIAKVTCLRLSARWIVDLAPIGFEMTAMTLLGADCSTVISAGNGQLSPALASRFNVNRTVECNTDAAGNLVEPDPRRFSTEARHALGASASSLLASAPPCKSQRGGP